MNDDRHSARRPRAVRLAVDEQGPVHGDAAAAERDSSAVEVGPDILARAEPPANGQARRPRAASPPLVEITPDPFVASAPEPAAGERAVELAQRRGIVRHALPGWVGLFWTALGGLVSLAVGIWVTTLVEGAFAHSPVLGAIGLALAGLASLALVVIGLREVIAIGRQRHIATLHADFAAAHATDDTTRARVLVAELAALYARRPETARSRAELLALRAEIVDGRDLIDIAERLLTAPLDGQAKALVATAAKRVSVVTTFAPRAIIDVIFVAAQTVRLVRQIAEVYGGRPGLFGMMKLARSVGTHLAITGGMAAGDTVLQQLVGHGIAAKLSARLGESVLNGLLTARIGLSAMAVCRPMPYRTEPEPTLRRVVPFLFRAGDDERAGKA